MASPFRAIQSALAEWSVKMLPVLVEAVRKEAPSGGTRQLAMFSGQDAMTTLAASIRGRARGTAGTARMEVLAGVSYAIIIRDGRGTVVPKKAKVLHWVNEAGEDVYAMSSGPVAANPYPARGYAKVRDQIRADLRDRMAQAAVQELLQTAKSGGMLTRL